MSETPDWEPEPARELTGAPDPEQAPRMGTLSRMFRVFTEPVEVFRDIARRPSWVAILLLMTLLTAGVQLVVVPHLDMEATIRQQMEERGQEMSQEQLDRIAENAGKFAWIGAGASIAFVPIIMALLAVIYMLGIKLAGSDAGFASTFSAVLHAYWPASVVKSIFVVLLAGRAGKMTAQEMQVLVRSNLGAFLPPEAPHWQQALGSFLDVFNLWTFVLLVLGLSLVGGISRKKAGTVAGLLWLLYVAGKVGLAALKG